MDYMIAYYPTIKLVAGGLFIAGGVYLTKHKHHKTALTLGAFALYLLILAPVKIDGTNTSDYHKANESYQEVKYKEVERASVLIPTPTPTFQERMDAENERSLIANKLIEGEI